MWLGRIENLDKPALLDKKIDQSNKKSNQIDKEIHRGPPQVSSTGVLHRGPKETLFFLIFFWICLVFSDFLVKY